MRTFKYLMLALVTFLGMCTFSSCEDDDVTPSKNSPVLHANETYTLPEGGKWTTGNGNIVKIDGNVARAVTVGTTTISNGSTSIKITVKPVYNYFSEPYLGWGASMATVKKNVKDYIFYSEEEDRLWYDFNDKDGFLTFDFTDGKLDQIMGVIYSSSLMECPNMDSFIRERYLPLGESKSEAGITFYYWCTNDVKTMVTTWIDIEDGDFVIFYEPISDDAKAPAYKEIAERHIKVHKARR